MRLSTQTIVQAAATAVGVFSLLWCFLVIFLSFVDPVLVMLAYFALPLVGFALLGHDGWLILTLFACLFIASHLVAILSTIAIEKN